MGNYCWQLLENLRLTADAEHEDTEPTSFELCFFRKYSVKKPGNLGFQVL
jgi:hypothetical protein